jgi:hypothetical protein
MEAVLRAIQWSLNSQLPMREKIEQISCLSKIGQAQLTDEWYGTIFQMAPEASKCGEMTPEYALLQDDGIQHILSLQPKVKLIFILRDPIERGWSHLRMDDHKGFASHLTLSQRALRNSNYLIYSDYIPTIDCFRRYVSDENFLMLYFDDIIARPEEVLRKSCEFIGLDHEWAGFEKINEPVHVGQAKVMEPDLYAIFCERMAPIYQRLLSLRNPIVESWYRRHYGNTPR